MACCISTLTEKYTRKSEGRVKVRLLLKSSTVCLVVVRKLSVPSNHSKVCHTFLFSPGKWVMQRTLWQQLLIWFCTTWSNLNLLKDDYSRPPHTNNDVSVVFAEGSQEKKKDKPVLGTGTLCTEESALLSIIMLQKMKQLFCLLNLLSFQTYRTLKMEAWLSSETMAITYKTTLYQNQDAHNTHLHCFEILKPPFNSFLLTDYTVFHDT